MKDYTRKKEPKFLIHYKVEDDKIIVYYANKTKEIIPYNLEKIQSLNLQLQNQYQMYADECYEHYKNRIAFDINFACVSLIAAFLLKENYECNMINTTIISMLLISSIYFLYHVIKDINYMKDIDNEFTDIFNNIYNDYYEEIDDIKVKQLTK